MKNDEFLEFAQFVFSEIKVFPNFILSEVALQKAIELTSKIDIKDTAYLALAIQFDQVLLTRDKPLEVGLKK